jgi:hypothetical protein
MRETKDDRPSKPTTRHRRPSLRTTEGQNRMQSLTEVAYTSHDEDDEGHAVNRHRKNDDAPPWVSMEGWRNQGQRNEDVVMRRMMRREDDGWGRRVRHSGGETRRMSSLARRGAGVVSFLGDVE